MSNNLTLRVLIDKKELDELRSVVKFHKKITIAVIPLVLLPAEVTTFMLMRTMPPYHFYLGCVFLTLFNPQESKSENRRD